MYVLHVEAPTNFKQIFILRSKQVQISVLQYDYAFDTEMMCINTLKFWFALSAWYV